MKTAHKHSINFKF